MDPNPRLLRDPVMRADLQKVMEDYFVENDTDEVNMEVVWDAFKAVVKGHCISTMSHLRHTQRLRREGLERELRDAELDLARTPTQQHIRTLNRIRGNCDF